MDPRNDLTWTKLIPCLTEAAVLESTRLRSVDATASWWTEDTPLETCARLGDSRLTRGHINNAIASTLGELHPREPFGRLLPHLRGDLPVAVLGELSTRAANTLNRAQCNWIGALAQFSVDDLRQMQNVGETTVRDITAALVAFATSEITEELERACEVPELQRTVLTALIRLAGWNRTNGGSAQPMIAPMIAVGGAVPEPVLAAYRTLAELTPADLLGPEPVVVEPAPEPAEEYSLPPVEACEWYIDQLTEREQMILVDRVLLVPPRTFSEVADDVGLSRERVRQLEKQAAARLDEFIARSRLGALLSELRNRLDGVERVENLVAALPELAGTVGTEVISVHRFLTAASETLWESDGWIADVELDQLKARTRALIEMIPLRSGQRHLSGVIDELRTICPDRHRDAWLAACGFLIEDESVIPSRISVNDLARSVLEDARTPLLFDDLYVRMDTPRRPQYIRNALGADESFTRVDRNRWALTSWGMRPYPGAKALIAEEIDGNGGEIAVAELVASITTRFDLAEQSILTYASMPPFETIQGVVRRRTAAPTFDSKRSMRRTYRGADGWRYSLVVNRDHLRGSGFPISSGLARALGCEPGQTIQFTSDQGPQTIRWTASQPACATIRRHLETMRINEKQLIFLEFGDDGTFRIRPVDTYEGSDRPMALILAGLGADPALANDEASAQAAVALAVGLPADAERTEILEAVYQRGGDPLAGPLAQHWKLPPSR